MAFHLYFTLSTAGSVIESDFGRAVKPVWLLDVLVFFKNRRLSLQVKLQERILLIISRYDYKRGKDDSMVMEGEFRGR